jgi:hypothetical protein
MVAICFWDPPIKKSVKFQAVFYKPGHVEEHCLSHAIGVMSCAPHAKNIA